MTDTSQPLPERAAQAAFTRLAVACFLCDLGVTTWRKLPAAARDSFAAGCGIPLELLPLVTQAIARYATDETALQQAHLNGALGALFDGPTPTTSQDTPA